MADNAAWRRRLRWIDRRAAFYTALIAGYSALAEWGPTSFLRWLGLVAFASALISAIRGAKWAK